MKMLVLALAAAPMWLAHGAEPGSLGIGIDVFSEAYGFAAKRIGFAPDIRLAGCRGTRCQWDLGEGLKVAADQAAQGLDIYRIEAALDGSAPSTPSARRRYEQACLAIVALVDRDSDSEPAEQRLTAAAIAGDTRSEIARDLADRNVNFYGVRGDVGITRCGAVAI